MTRLVMLIAILALLFAAIHQAHVIKKQNDVLVFLAGFHGYEGG